MTKGIDFIVYVLSVFDCVHAGTGLLFALGCRPCLALVEAPTKSGEDGNCDGYEDFNH
jgi:hypothetical protein